MSRTYVIRAVHAHRGGKWAQASSDACTIDVCVNGSYNIRTSLLPEAPRDHCDPFSSTTP
eukprot:5264946-Prymnesium_polylepis.1